jgi:hypothetical protein
MKDRYANLARIRTLDPEQNYLQIYQTMVRHEFPWDLKLALNLAFNRSFSTPAVAAVLTRTGELIEHTQKRIDDTGLLMYELVLNGFDNPRGRDVLRRVNHIHRPHRNVSNDEYLFVLACGAVIPLRWLDRYGWRPLSSNERQATYLFYRELGRRMNITGIPGSLDELQEWFDAYDQQQLVPNDDAAAVERATRMLLLTRIPRPFAPLGDALVSAMYDERLRAAMKVPTPAWLVRTGLHLGLKTRARILRHLGRPRRVALFTDGIVTKTYPDGYDINDLGPASSREASDV